MSRETMATMLADAPPHTKPRIVANNTVRYTAADGATAWRLHHTDVVTHHVDGTWTLDSGGWKTVTTKDRMCQFAPCTIRSDRGIWYVGDVPFYDGMKLSADGTPITNGHDTATIAQDARALKRKISKFVCLIDTCDALPMPDAGDCFFCQMHEVKTGKPLGEVTGYADHLVSHMDEGYLVGSLLVNAMRDRGFTNEGIALHYQMNFRDTFKRAVHRYLGRAFGLAVK